MYVPLDELAQYNITEEEVVRGMFAPATGRVDDRWRAFMAFQIKRARDIFAEAEAGVNLLDADARCVRARVRLPQRWRFLTALLFADRVCCGCAPLRDARWPVWSALILYRQILDAIEANDYDNFTRWVGPGAFTRIRGSYSGLDCICSWGRNAAERQNAADTKLRWMVNNLPPVARMSCFPEKAAPPDSRFVAQEGVRAKVAQAGQPANGAGHGQAAKGRVILCGRGRDGRLHAKRDAAAAAPCFPAWDCSLSCDMESCKGPSRRRCLPPRPPTPAYTRKLDTLLHRRVCSPLYGGLLFLTGAGCCCQRCSCSLRLCHEPYTPAAHGSHAY